jgi:hypothetical protein
MKSLWSKIRGHIFWGKWDTDIKFVFKSFDAKEYQVVQCCVYRVGWSWGFVEPQVVGNRVTFNGSEWVRINSNCMKKPIGFSYRVGFLMISDNEELQYYPAEELCQN